MNARFWIRWNRSWVKLTLAQGQTLTLHEGGPTDEGWQSTSRLYRHDGDTVRLEISDQSQDCDGRHGDERELVCPLADLRSNRDVDDADADAGRPPLPEWELESGRCRDQFAEAAGY
jgi:hypothetical protein